MFWSKNGDVVYTRMASDCSQFDTIVDTTVEFTCTNSKNFTLTFKEVKKNQDGKRWSCVLDTNPSTSSAEVTIKIKGRLIFIISLTLKRLETTKWVLWQTVNTQMKCHQGLHCLLDKKQYSETEIQHL